MGLSNSMIIEYSVIKSISYSYMFK